MFEAKKFDVEHALSMYADSFAQLPAASIYDEAALEPLKEVIEKCHIYVIGTLPVVNVESVDLAHEIFGVVVSSLGQSHKLTWDLPEGWKLFKDEEPYYLIAPNGDCYAPGDSDILAKLRSTGVRLDFDVQYIGQAYGDEGSRTALDRLRKHETLQKIALEGIKEGHRLEVLLLEVVPANRIITVFNPKAEERKTGEERIKAGLDKLFRTTEKERISLYEAALIRYFKPPYNSKFKESFPSTNMTVLKDCYNKDFSAVIAEIGFDELPYELFSNHIEAQNHHIAGYDLHDETDRKVFFSYK
jgi:hypothetical protein